MADIVVHAQGERGLLSQTEAARQSERPHQRGEIPRQLSLMSCFFEDLFFIFTYMLGLLAEEEKRKGKHNHLLICSK